MYGLCCTMYTVNCTVCTLYTALHCKLHYTLHCTLYSVQCTYLPLKLYSNMGNMVIYAPTMSRDVKVKTKVINVVKVKHMPVVM